jgi:hypothetical protein
VLGTFLVNFVIENCCFSILGIHGGAGGLDEPDCIGEGTEISDRTKETIAGLQKNITRIITKEIHLIKIMLFRNSKFQY